MNSFWVFLTQSRYMLGIIFHELFWYFMGLFSPHLIKHLWNISKILLNISFNFLIITLIYENINTKALFTYLLYLVVLLK